MMVNCRWKARHDHGSMAETQERGARLVFATDRYGAENAFYPQNRFPPTRTSSLQSRPI